jgi:hypothetical protein
MGSDNTKELVARIEYYLLECQTNNTPWQHPEIIEIVGDFNITLKDPLPAPAGVESVREKIGE